MMGTMIAIFFKYSNSARKFLRPECVLTVNNSDFVLYCCRFLQFQTMG
jgi:hypothetical protein